MAGLPSGTVTFLFTDIEGSTALWERAGDEVVQLYWRDPAASVARPVRLLVGSVPVGLELGQTHRVTFTVQPSRLAFYDPRMRFGTEPEAFLFSGGDSATDVRAEQTVTLAGDVAAYRQRGVVATAVEIG